MRVTTRRQVLRELGCHWDFSIMRTSLGRLHRLPRITMTASALDASHTILHNSIMKRSPVIGVVPQFFIIIGIAFARDDAPPSAVRPWAPPTLPSYEGELRQYRLTQAEGRYLPAIDPHKTYNLAELIDIAQRSNPETRVAWERARQAAAAVGLTESAYYPYIVAAAAGGYDRAFVAVPPLGTEPQPPPTNGNLPNAETVGGGN